MKDSLGCNWFKRSCASSASFYCPPHPFFLSCRFQYTKIMADVNEWMRGRKERESRKKDMSHTSVFLWFCLSVGALPFYRNVCRVTWSSDADWSWRWHWNTASSVHCLWRRLPVCLGSSLPTSPRHPEIKTDKNISSNFRTSRSLTHLFRLWTPHHQVQIFSFCLSLSLSPVLHGTGSSSFFCLLFAQRPQRFVLKCNVCWGWPQWPPTSRIRTSISSRLTASSLPISDTSHWTSPSLTLPSSWLHGFQVHAFNHCKHLKNSWLSSWFNSRTSHNV